MPSGGKQMLWNTFERALSTDNDRAQDFLACDMALTRQREQNDYRLTDDLDAGSGYQVRSTVGTPPYAEIVGGYCVRPQLGSSGTGLDLYVDPGVACVIYPDSDADASNYKLVYRDPGINTPGTLTMTANSSGSIRIDVIEVSYTLNGSAETAIRDVYSPSAGVFNSVMVNKAQQAVWTYRVRLGTPGAGFPGVVSGWLPLAVASVPTGTTVNDTITFWDVRPMIADRVKAPYNLSSEAPIRGPAAMSVSVRGAQSILTGYCDVTATDIVNGVYGETRLGGRLRRGTPGADIPLTGFDGLDLANVANQDGTVTPGANYLYLAEPFGLPRWARYTDATTGARNPRSPRGIPILSNTQPNTWPYNGPHTAINMPASTGLGGATSKAVCILAVGTLSSGSSQPAGALYNGQTGLVANGAFCSFNVGVSTAAFTTSVATFNLSEGNNHPSLARGVWVTFVLTLTSAGAFGISSADIEDGTGAVLGSVGRGLSGAPQSNTPSISFYVPLFPVYAQGEQGTVVGRLLAVNYGVLSGGPAVGASLQIDGWDY